MNILRFQMICYAVEGPAAAAGGCEASKCCPPVSKAPSTGNIPTPKLRSQQVGRTSPGCNKADVECWGSGSRHDPKLLAGL
jgi:hypothetical protein